ncbi:hypothetical protein L1887_48561 [Cichorium endivia]|nr:hypothetical protein L1887_48561 [Cichorium endivia]
MARTGSWLDALGWRQCAPVEEQTPAGVQEGPCRSGKFDFVACAPRSPASSDRSWAHLTLRKRPLRCWDCGAARPASSFRRRLNEAVTTSGFVSADDGDIRDQLEKAGAVALPHTRSRQDSLRLAYIPIELPWLAGWLASALLRLASMLRAWMLKMVETRSRAAETLALLGRLRRHAAASPSEA